MIKKVFLTVAVIGMAIVATVNVNLSLNSRNGLSDTLVANVEALSSETSDICYCYTLVFQSPSLWSCFLGGKSACNYDFNF